MDVETMIAATALDTPRFREAWELWRKHRVEKKNTLTPTTIKMQIKFLLSMGHDRAIAAIERSITNGWTGLFVVENSDGANRQGGPRSPARVQAPPGKYAGIEARRMAALAKPEAPAGSDSDRGDGTNGGQGGDSCLF